MVWEKADFTLKRRIANFIEAENQLLEIKNLFFPVPCVVFVDSGRFTGIGLVWRETADEGPTQLAVMVENGNTWSYPLEDCDRIDNQLRWPQWAKDFVAEYESTNSK